MQEVWGYLPDVLRRPGKRRYCRLCVLRLHVRNRLHAKEL